MGIYGWKEMKKKHKINLNTTDPKKIQYALANFDNFSRHVRFQMEGLQKIYSYGMISFLILTIHIIIKYQEIKLNGFWIAYFDTVDFDGVGIFFIYFPPICLLLAILLLVYRKKTFHKRMKELFERYQKSGMLLYPSQTNVTYVINKFGTSRMGNDERYHVYILSERKVANVIAKEINQKLQVALQTNSSRQFIKIFKSNNVHSKVVRLSDVFPNYKNENAFIYTSKSTGPMIDRSLDSIVLIIPDNQGIYEFFFLI